MFDPECVDPTDPHCWLDGAYVAAAERNAEFMKTAATIEFVRTPSRTECNDDFEATVRITNLTGHKLPTGYPEGRRMWIDIKAVDAALRSGIKLQATPRVRREQLTCPGASGMEGGRSTVFLRQRLYTLRVRAPDSSGTACS